MKNMLIILAAIMILAGGAVSTLKFLKMGPFAEKPAVEVEEVEEEAKSIFIDMEPILIPIFQGDTVAAKIQIQIKLETKSKDNAIKIQRLMPKISNIFITDMHAFLPRLIKQQERVDVIILKARLKKIVSRKLEKGLIDDILVQSVLDTPAN
jgi:flagellar basal body-associated protein FliL